MAPHTAHNSLALDASLADDLVDAAASYASASPLEKPAAAERAREALRAIRVKVAECLAPDAPGWASSRNPGTFPRNRRRKKEPRGDFYTLRTEGRASTTPTKFRDEFLDFSTRRRWEATFGDGVVVEALEWGATSAPPPPPPPPPPPEDTGEADEELGEGAGDLRLGQWYEDGAAPTKPQETTRSVDVADVFSDTAEPTSPRDDDDATVSEKIVEQLVARPKSDALGGVGRSLEESSCPRIVFRTAAMPAPFRMRQVCCLQDSFDAVDLGKDDGACYAYEMSVRHARVREEPGHATAEVLLLAHRAAPHGTDACDLVVVSQVDAGRTSAVPRWAKAGGPRGARLRDAASPNSPVLWRVPLGTRR